MRRREAPVAPPEDSAQIPCAPVTSSRPRTISHALLDRALEVFAKDPLEWTHADDVFLLSLCTAKVKKEVTGLLQKGQARDNVLNKEDGFPSHELALLRPRIAAGVDWTMLLAPLQEKTQIMAGGYGKAWFKARRGNRSRSEGAL